MNKEYLHKSALDLAQEPGFIEWVNTLDTLEAQLWAEWIKNHPEIKEQVDKAKSLVQAISFEDGFDLHEKENKIWGNITQEIGSRENIKSTKYVLLRRYITVAAIAASIILPLFIFLGDSNKIIKATSGEHIAYNFPDQSAIQLNSGSSIEYNPSKWETKREVILKGEAYFEVEKGKQFEVVTNNGSVVVLGTSFNVYSRGKRFEVSCLTGKVEVKTEQHTLVLNPGDAVILNIEKKRLETSASLEDKKIDWLEGEYHFTNAALSDVFEEMERQFNVEISLERQKMNTKFTGSFVTENIDSALYQVCWPMKLQSNKINNKIVIKATGTE